MQTKCARAKMLAQANWGIPFVYKLFVTSTPIAKANNVVCRSTTMDARPLLRSLAAPKPILAKLTRTVRRMEVIAQCRVVGPMQNGNVPAGRVLSAGHSSLKVKLGRLRLGRELIGKRLSYSMSTRSMTMCAMRRRTITSKWRRWNTPPLPVLRDSRCN